jgi:hypothetical protein
VSGGIRCAPLAEYPIDNNDEGERYTPGPNAAPFF